MKVIINNKSEEIPRDVNIAEFFKHRNIKPESVVLWVNGNKLRIREYPDYMIQENDELRILRIIGGG